MSRTNIKLCLWPLILNLIVVVGVAAAIERGPQASPSVIESGTYFHNDRADDLDQDLDRDPGNKALWADLSASTPSPRILWTFTAPNAIWHLDSWGDGLTTGDLNGDGVPDVALGTQAGYVIAVSGADGTELWSYRITTQTDAPVNADVVDVDDDGLLDVVATGVGSKAIIHALESDGSLKWSATGDYEEAVDLAYGDVDGDGDTDVVASVGTYPWSGGQVILLEGADGTRLWTRSLGSGHAQGLAAQDVDGDGDMDVAVENYDNKVFLLDGQDGNVHWSRSKGWYGRDVVIADVDDDGSYEIVSGGGGLTCYAPNGDQEWDADAEREGGNISVGDVNGDHETEVLFSDGFSGEFYALNGSTGSTLAPWPRTRSGAHVIGDVDGDNVDDVVMGTIRFWGISPPYSVDAVDGSNNLIWSYPLDAIHNEGGFGLAAANLDDDPALEVLVANGTQLIALTLTKPDLLPVGLEVTQAIQSITNTVTLVQGKRAYARFHVSTDGTTLARVSAQLSATRDRQSLGDPLQPDNPNMVITATANPERGSLDDSFYFELPPQWLSGTLELSAEVNPLHAIAESDYQNNIFTSTVTFQPTPPLTVTVVGVTYISNHVTYRPCITDYERIASWLRAAYPTDHLTLITRTLDVGLGPPRVGNLNRRLAAMYVFDAGDTDQCPTTRYYGLVHDGGGFMRGRAIGIPGCVASGPTGDSTWGWDFDGSYGDWYAGHELGHTLGRRHTLCRNDEDGPDPDYPYPNGRIGGPFYGFNVETLEIYTPTLWADVMSYCNNQWISDYTYEGIRRQLISETTQLTAAVSRVSASADGYLVVLGDMNLTQGTAQLGALYHLPDLTPSTRPAISTYTLRLLDAGDGLLADYPFTPKQDTEPQSGEDLAATIFEIVPYAAGTAQVVVTCDSSKVASLTVSANPPTVTVSYPLVNGSLGGIETIAWSGGDLDGDSLTYALLYSADDGATWTTLATEITDTHHILRTDELAGSEAGRIRVLVSDGVNTAWDDVTGLTLPLKSPTVRITSPRTGESYLDEQTVILTGYAYDRETGYLDGSALVWQSSLDVTLGSGASIAVMRLSKGEHTITLRATDDDAMTGTASITLFIAARPRLYLPLILR